MQSRRAATVVVAVLLADAGLEVADAVTFGVMAATAGARPDADQLAVLASLILPRLVFAGLAVHVGRRVATGDARVAGTALGLLLLLAIQAGAGLFMLWGSGGTVPARVVLTVANVAAAVAVARQPAMGLSRVLGGERTDSAR